jgi:hypothetical protein
MFPQIQTDGTDFDLERDVSERRPVESIRTIITPVNRALRHRGIANDDEGDDDGRCRRRRGAIRDKCALNETAGKYGWRFS